MKAPRDFRIIGTPTSRYDGPALVTGQAQFGLDTRRPNLLFATVARPLSFGASVASFDEAAARAVPRVRQVFRGSGGVVVVAESTWAALSGREALKATWNLGPNADLDDQVIRQTLRARTAALPEAAQVYLPRVSRNR